MHTPGSPLDTCWHIRRKSLSKLSKFYEYKRSREKGGDRGTILRQPHTKKEKKSHHGHSFFVCDCRCWSDSSSRRENKRGKQTKKRKKERLYSLVSMKHNPSLIASRLSSLRYSVGLYRKIPCYITLLRYILRCFHDHCAIAMSVFFFFRGYYYYYHYYYSFSAAMISGLSQNPA